MNSKKFLAMGVLVLTLAIPSQSEGKSNSPVKQSFTGAKGEVKIITLDPGHFHAALVQKKMYDQVNPEVHVYAPEGSDVAEHLKRIEAYNNRKDSPTGWKELVFKGNDYFSRMLSDKQGNVVVLAGNNRIKTEYIKKSVEAGFNVLADKPMVISPENFPMLEESFKIAAKNGVILYDIMTERHEITTMLQKELSQNPVIFGSLQKGTKDKPAVEKLSVHYFYKSVSGVTLVRPGWFFDVDQQGEGIVDVATHLIDLVQWICFPGVVLKKSDIEMLQAKHWPTILTLDEFKAVTQLDKYPDYLSKAVKDGKLNEYANGEMTYKIKGIFAKVTAEWRYKAPESSGDTHYSVMRGTKGTVEILQGDKEKYMPTLYVHANPGTAIPAFKAELEKSILKNKVHAGLNLEKVDESTWKVIIPDQYKVGHEAHFSQVTEKYLEFLKSGKLPEWEVPNMIVKYYTATEALKMARK